MGRWVRIFGSYHDGIVVFKCSECGVVGVWKDGMTSLYPSDICPSCHSDMKSRRSACLGGKVG